MKRLVRVSTAEAVVIGTSKLTRPKLRWTKIRAGHLWHAKSFQDGPLIGFIRGTTVGWWDCYLVVPDAKWPDRERLISSCRRFNDAKRTVETATDAQSSPIGDERPRVRARGTKPQ